MSVDPKRVAMQVALRTQQVRGTNQTTLQANYLAGMLSGLDGADIPLSGLIDAVLAVESEMVEIIATDRTHPYRNLFYGRSDDLPNATEIPSLSDELYRFVGVFSGVCDSADDGMLTEGSVQEITRHVRGNYQGTVRKYKMSAGKLYHTRSFVYLEGCVWSRAIALTKLAGGPTDVSQIPNALETVWVARAIEFLTMEGWLMQEAAHYGNVARTGIERLRGRNLEAPQMPGTNTTPDPVRN